MSDQRTITMDEAIAAIGYLSARLADVSGAWDGRAPDWFPDPPEFLELFEEGLARTRWLTEDSWKPKVEGNQRALWEGSD